MCGQGLAVRISAVAADELDGMVQPRQPHRHVEGAAADMGLDAGGPLDYINQSFANNCEHDHTLPENPLRRRVLRARPLPPGLPASRPRCSGGRGVQRNPGGRGIAEPGVDVDNVSARPLEEAGGDPGTVPGSAVHPELPGGDVPKAQQQLVQRHVNRTEHAGSSEFVGPAHVQDGVPGGPAGQHASQPTRG